MNDQLNQMSNADLEREFLRLSLEEYQAGVASQFRHLKRVVMQRFEIENELRERPNDQRRVLIPLCEHPNSQVRLNAAVAVLAIAPDRARKTLEELAVARQHPQSAEASMTLKAIDRGEFVPT